MLLVIPVSQSDKNLIPDVQKAFEKFPPGASHDLLVIGFPSVSQEISIFAETLSKHFRKTFIHILPADNNMGWPMEMNILFRSTAAHVTSLLKENECWMWFELDTFPLKPNWLSDLSTQYYSDVILAEKQNRKPKRFLGVKEVSIRAQNGEQLSVDRAGHCMTAVGLYPGNFEQIAKPLLKVLPSYQSPFYQVLQWYVINDLQETALIQNNRETINYTPEGCESCARNPWDVHWNKPISKEALVIHGCKDGSLARMLLQEAPAPEKPVAPPPPQAPLVEQVSTPDPAVASESTDTPPTLQRRRGRRKVAEWTPERRAYMADLMRARQEKIRQARAEKAHPPQLIPQ